MNLSVSKFCMIFIFAITFLFFSSLIRGQESSYENKKVTYTINYAKNSKIKSPSLKNVTVKVQLYLGGKTIEKLTRITDQNQSFTIDNRHASLHGSQLIAAVHSVEGAEKDISCYGASLPGKTTIVIDCHPRSENKHFH